MFSKKFVSCGLGIVAALFIFGCGGSSKSTTSTPVTPLPVSVTVTPSATTLDATNPVTLSAGVINDKNAAGVSWTVGGGGTLSASSTTGTTYTAPAASASALKVTVTATSITDPTKTGTATINVPVGPAITTASLVAGTVGTAYSATLVGGGGISPYSWSLTSAALPSGLSMNTTGVISGVPLAAGVGTTKLTFTMTDSGKATALTTTVQLALTINAAPAANEPLTIDSKKLPAAYIGIPYSQTLTAHDGSGTGYSWTLGSGSTLPAGLTLSTAGVVAGKPTAAGIIPFTATVTDSASNTVSAKFSITVSVGVSITSLPTLPNGFVGGNYNTTLAAIGGSNPYTWTVTNGSTLPAGLNLLAGGALKGIPTTAGPYTFSITVTDSASNSASASFSLGVEVGVTITTPGTLPAGTVGVIYTKALTATGGTGTGYTWTVDAPGASSLAGLKLTLSNGGLISGIPTAAGTAAFTVKVLDSFADSASATFTLEVAIAGSPTLPAANPISLPSATVNQIYSGSVNAAGGAPPYVWTVNGVKVATNGFAQSLSNGLSVMNDGTHVLSVSGTPSATGTVTFDAMIADSLGAKSGTTTYTVAVNAAGAQVSGHIGLTDNCGGVTAPTISVSINTSPVQTTSTDTNGDYSFANVPSGTYTITPSITGPSFVFFPTTLSSSVVSTNSLDKQDFTVSLGYIVSGTVSYSGPKTGQVYVSLNNTSCVGKPLGTSISAPGAFIIRGVPPGTYNLSARMDTQKNGNANASDPTGNSPSVAISDSNVVTASVTLIDPATYTLPVGPRLTSISPSDQGVVINYGAITNSSKVELPTAYIVEWSTDSTFASSSSATFKAGGANGSGVWFLNDSTPGITGTFNNGTPYYFRACGEVASVTSPCTVYGGATPLPITIGAPTGANTVTGAITFGDAPTGPLYVGFFDEETKKAYVTRIAIPVSPHTYTIQVPNGSDYSFFAILDQNNNGSIDPGDVSNTRNDKSDTVVITDYMTKDLTLSAANSTASVTTQHFKQTYLKGNSEGYTLSLDVQEGIKLPVSVALTSGTSVVNPIDIGKCQDCGNNQFQYSVGTGGTTPTINDSYVFNVTFNDGTKEDVTAKVSGVVDAFATNLTPVGSAKLGTEPTFMWIDPTDAANYTYQFNLSDDKGNQVWQIPGNNSKSNGFSSSITSIVWGTSPTSDSSNVPSIPSLGSTIQYFWQIQVQDENGNSAQTQVEYLP